ncbi:ATP-binding protein [Endozoicomonas sp. (ex Bugula neritina AB1)]|nr:ATP-binding protein [Endozoicomonas sp. (ex Bugula neritina AB1)]
MNAPAATQQEHVSHFTLEPDDPRRFAELCGELNQHLKQLEERIGITIRHRGNTFAVSGEEERVNVASELIKRLYRETGKDEELTPNTVHLYLQESAIEWIAKTEDDGKPVILRTRKGTITPRGPNQQRYVKSILKHDINFGIGPAGTGKTYLAVAAAVQALEEEQVRRIMLVRPAVEAGEKLGFLPGDLAQKIDPYLRPLYDALYEMMGFERVDRLIEKNVIEVAPLAYMRGRTLNNSFIILDEAQNTTPEQMKMFLTRIGFGSTAVVTGDITQVDLPRGTQSGLKSVIDILKNVNGIGFNWFTSKDVVRHPLVQRIVQAYDHHDRQTQSNQSQSSKGV